MKFLKILSVILVIAMLSSFFISCEGVTVKYEIEGCFEKKEDVKNNDDQGVAPDDEEQARYKVKAHVKVVDYNNKELYSTDELFEYVVSVAEGRETRNEINDYREISIFKDGVTL